MLQECAVSGASVSIAIYYLIGSGTSFAIAATATKGVGGSADGDLIAFGVSGYATTGSPASPVFDGACSTSSGTGNPSLAVATTYANDFVFAAAAVAASSATISSGTSIASASASSSLVGVAGYDYGEVGTSSYTLSWTASGSPSWQEMGAAVENQSPSPVPLLPYGVLPFLIVIPALYSYLRSRTSIQNAKGDKK
jgi:hypothetical protein